MKNEKRAGLREAISLPDEQPPGAGESLSGKCPVVGFGASAGGLEAFSDVLKNLFSDTGFALVFIQHLDPNHSSILTELLSRATPLPVVQATDGLELEPNRVYVIPPNSNMTVVQGALHLEPRPHTRQHMPVDHFFNSLAEDQQEKAIGVVLSGNASDGTLGLEAIKAKGGITMVQDFGSAKYDGMPRSAAAAGSVDFVLPPEGIARELFSLSRHPYFQQLEAAGEPAPSDDRRQLNDIFAMLRTATGVDFSHYKPGTLRRRIMRRMALQTMETLEQYAEFLRQNPGELQLLFQDILINVTAFFREPQTFEAIQSHVLPAICQNKTLDDPVRVWVPGCATGEEVYSIGICLLEHMRDGGIETPIQIFGTDLSDTALDKARAGIYPESIAADVSADRLRRFFVPVNGNFQIARSVRDACIFARQNVARDPPFSKIDLILCRNVLIYLGSALQASVLRLFHYALKPQGFLALGVSESVGYTQDLFTSLDKKVKIYVKRPVEPTADPRLGTYQEPRARSPQKPSAPPPGNPDVHNKVDPLLTRHSPRAAVERPSRARSGAKAPATARRIRELERELGTAREQLKTIVEEQEAATEELKSAHEEMQSGNEELQSTNEELLTAKEELQSTNEELTTVNEEMHGRNAELQLSNNDLQNLLSSVNIPIVMLGSDLRIRRFTAQAERLFNLVPTDAGRPISDFRPKINIPDLTELCRDTIVTLSSKEREVQDMEGRSYALWIRPYRTSDNRIDGVVLSLFDVTERKQSAEARYRRLFEAAIDGIILVDAASGEIVDVNPFIVKLFGYPRIQLIGSRYWESLLFRDSGMDQSLLAQLESGAVQMILNLPAASGEIIETELQSNLYTEGEKKVVQFNLRDLSMRKRVEGQLRREEEQARQAYMLEAVGRLAGGVAHDFNNLLTAILGYCDLLHGELGDQHPARPLVAKIAAAGDQAAMLNRQLVAFGRKPVAKASVLDLNTVISEMRQLLAVTLPASIELVLGLQPVRHPVMADRGQLEQMILSIVIHGRDAMPDGGKIILQTSQALVDQNSEDLPRAVPPGKYVTLTVRDTSAGMDAQTRARIFEPSLRTRPKGEEAGFGLSAAYAVVKQSGGFISVSSALGTGTTFTVYLPLAAEESGEDNAAKSPDAAGGTEIILVVEDDPAVRALVCRLLEQFGYRVLEAGGGAEAIRISRAYDGQIDLLLTDVVMPNMSGREVAFQLAAQRPTMKVIYMSGHTEEVIVQHGVLEDRMTFLQKPFTPCGLALKLRDVLDRVSPVTVKH